jgi:hypothetical protein
LYVPVSVDILVGQRDEIAGPDTGFDRNKPPAAASKIETLTLSPMPNVISLGGRRSGNTVPILGA